MPLKRVPPSQDQFYDTLASYSMLNSSGFSRNSSGTTEGLSADNVPSDMSELVGFMAKMLATQQQQMRLYEQQVQLFSQQLSSSSISNSADKMQLSDYPKFTEAISNDDSI